jgi:hypothetical protein
MIPLAMLARVAAAGGVGAAETAAARAATTARGAAWRQAMGAAGGNKDVAREAIRQKASDLREDERARRQQAQDDAREQARQMNQQEQQQRSVGRQMTPAYMKTMFGGMMGGHVTGGAEVFGDVASKLAGNDFRGIATGALPGPLAKLLDSFGKAADAFDARGRELAKFSPDISVAKSNSFVRQFQADQYEASVAGGSYAELIEQLADLQADIQEDLAPLKNEVAKSLAELVGGLHQILEDTHLVPLIVDGLIQLKIVNEQVGKAMLDALSGNFGKAAGDLADHRGQDRQEPRGAGGGRGAAEGAVRPHLGAAPHAAAPAPGAEPAGR